MINIKCHDIKYKLGELFAAEGKISSKAVDDLYKSISIYDSKVETGNELLDVLLTEKSLYCEKNKIKLTIMAEGGDLSFMSDADIYSLFGNILDNAVEAVIKVPPERRAVTLSVKTVGNMLIVHEQNYYAGRIKFVKGAPVTSKGNTNEHGYGILSIRRIVEKYEGGLNVSAEDGIFSLDAAIRCRSAGSAAKAG